MPPANHRPGVTFALLIEAMGILGDRHVAGRTIEGADPVVGDFFYLVDEAGVCRWQVEAVWYPTVEEFPAFGGAWVAALLVAPVTLRLVA